MILKTQLLNFLQVVFPKGGLTDKQAKIIDKYIDKYRYLWSESNKNELKLIEGGKNAAIN